MKIILQHPTGNQFVRALLSALHESDCLAEFETTIAARPSAVWLKLLPAQLRNEWLRRQYPVPYNKISTNPYRELVRMILPRLGFKGVIEHERGWASVDSIYKDLDNKVANRLISLVKGKNATAVYCYEDGSLATFKVAKALGLKNFYDLPIAYWETGRKLMEEEAIRLPNWAGTLAGGIRDSEEKLERKVKELELADAVIVPGDFVKGSLPDWALKKQIIVAPFGTPSFIERESAATNFMERADRPIRILFVGSLTQRKGLGDLFEAIKLVNSSKVQLVVMGAPVKPISFYKSEFPDFIYEQGRPHEQVLELMQSCDVFCLPSIVEGRALVMQEAMSQGLPLIITANTGGADLIKEGETGFLVPIRSPDKIAEKIQWFLENRQQIAEMGRMAQVHAATYTWKSYGKKVTGSLSAAL